MPRALPTSGRHHVLSGQVEDRIDVLKRCSHLSRHHDGTLIARPEDTAAIADGEGDIEVGDVYIL